MKKFYENPKNKGFPSHSQEKNSNEAVELGVNELCSKLGISKKELILHIEAGESSLIPVSIFSNEQLSGLELVSRYLIENKRMSASGTANLLNRSYQTIWTEYKNSIRKLKGRISIPKSRYFFPLGIMADRKLSILEAIVVFMKEELGLRFSDIAAELHRDARNIWTVYKRANAKKK